MTKNLTGLLELETSLMQSINPERKAKIDQIALSIFDQVLPDQMSSLSVYTIQEGVIWHKFGLHLLYVNLS